MMLRLLLCVVQSLLFSLTFPLQVLHQKLSHQVSQIVVSWHYVEWLEANLHRTTNLFASWDRHAKVSTGIALKASSKQRTHTCEPL